MNPMRWHRRVAVVLVCLVGLAACGADDDSARTTEQLTARVEAVRAAADDRDVAAFAAATAELRAAVATMQNDGSLTDEKATAVLHQLGDVEVKFQQVLPPTTAAPTTTLASTTTAPAPPTTPVPPTEAEPPRGKGKKKHEDED